MDLLFRALVFLHLLSWAVVLGLSLGYLRKREVPKGVMHGAISALVTGVLIVGVVEMGDLFALNHVKIGIKTVVAAVVTVLAVMAERKRNGHKWLGAIAGLVVLNVGIAVFW
ncbi:MAG TPA: hypothetical protein VFC82_01125 [Actinomycetaceae bacterium]|nr:hypothetical protein [Actinomycetaceae bacterium]